MAEKPAKGPFSYGKGGLQGPQSGNQSKVCQREGTWNNSPVSSCLVDKLGAGSGEGTPVNY